MTRKSWVYVNGEPIPKEDYVPPQVDAPYFVPEIQAFKSPVTGEIIDGRAAKRQHVQRHGLIEVGNEYIPPKPIPEVSGLKEEIIRNYNR